VDKFDRWPLGRHQFLSLERPDDFFEVFDMRGTLRNRHADNAAKLTKCDGNEIFLQFYAGFIITAYPNSMTLLTILDLLATFAFALVGARVAADKGLDYGGMALISAVASLAGGTLRNVLLGMRPIWIIDPWIVAKRTFCNLDHSCLSSGYSHW
jgi:hypothetical protein